MAKKTEKIEVVEEQEIIQEPKNGGDYAEIENELDKIFYTVNAINELIEVSENLDQYFDDNPKCDKIRRIMENKIEYLVKSL